MTNVSSEFLPSDKELETLRGKCYLLEEKVKEIMMELLAEIDKQSCDETLKCEVKEDIKKLTNKIFEEPKLEGE